MMASMTEITTQYFFQIMITVILRTHALMEQRALVPTLVMCVNASWDLGVKNVKVRVTDYILVFFCLVKTSFLQWPNTTPGLPGTKHQSPFPTPIAIYSRKERFSYFPQEATTRIDLQDGETSFLVKLPKITISHQSCCLNYKYN